MDEERQTQKQVGRKYQGNLAYFRKQPLFFRVRFLLGFCALVAAIFAIYWVERRRADITYNPAPLSVSHAFLEGNCAACHGLASKEIVPSSRLAGWFGTLRAQLSGQSYHHWETPQSINESCQACHANMELHQPSAQTVALSDFHRSLHVVSASECYSCHQEHLGRIAMKLPGDTACAACHDNSAHMSNDVRALPLPGRGATSVAINATTPDGVIHFIPPQEDRPLPTFASFERGHPPFEYERPGLRDPDILSFNHQRHAAADIPLIDGKKLSCDYCHKLAADGVFYARVKYEQACQACHALQFDSNNPQLVLPHGNVEQVRTFLRSLPYEYTKLAQARTSSPADQKAFVLQQMLALRQRVRSGEDFEKEIFFTKNPYRDQPTLGQRSLFPGCAYCHQVGLSKTAEPVVTPPRMADRWLEHGAFTHAKHTTIACISCHDANHSRDTADIIMPAKDSCVSCHSTKGGAPSNCLACHTFHSPVQTAQAIKARWKLSEMAKPPGSPLPEGIALSGIPIR